MPGFAREKVKQVYFLITLTVLGGLLAWMLRDFIGSFLGAVTIYIVLRKPVAFLTHQRGWPKGLTTLLFLLLSFFILVMPIALLSAMLSSKVQYLVSHYESFWEIIKGWNTTISSRIGLNVLSNDALAKLAASGANIVPSLLSATFSSLAQLLIMFLLLYFLLSEGRALEKIIWKYSPFQPDNTGLLLRELKSQTLINAIGIPMAGLVQACCSGIGYWIFGMDEPFFWAVITGFAVVIPIVGTAVVWLPVTIYMFVNGSSAWHGMGMAIYSVALLTNADSLVRIWLMNKLGHMHPLVIFFGIIIGLQLFGFLGLIFGPLLISYFLILLNIYHREYLTS